MFSVTLRLIACQKIFFFSTWQMFARLFFPGRFFAWKKSVFSTNWQKLANPANWRTNDLL
jgi:hypothetical protein